MLGRGFILGVAWLFWFVGGIAYAQMHGPVRPWLSEMSQVDKLFIAAWVIVSASLLFYAIAFTLRGLAGSKTLPRV
jgi:hypothetical protein